jgi:hypothetical protein
VLTRGEQICFIKLGGFFCHSKDLNSEWGPTAAFSVQFRKYGVRVGEGGGG